MSLPTFSLCHASARLPDGWVPAALAWCNNADHPETVEHVVVTDEPLIAPRAIFMQTLFRVNTGRRCAVDAWNKAADLSAGKVLITVADDWFPCLHWDTELLTVIPDLDGEYVVEVDTGGNPGLLTFSMLTRKYYERYGYIFYPEYLGMLADDDFTAVARRDGVVIDARHLFFQHKHPAYGTAEMDAVYEHQHRPIAFEVGERVFKRRQQEGFTK